MIAKITISIDAMHLYNSTYVIRPLARPSIGYTCMIRILRSSALYILIVYPGLRSLAAGVGGELRQDGH